MAQPKFNWGSDSESNNFECHFQKSIISSCFISVYDDFDIIIGLLIGWILVSNECVVGWFINYINKLNYNQ